MIRIFFGGENGTHRWKLFNLRDDLGEKNDLAAQQPDRVKSMDALIEGFLADTQAVQPLRNPAFDPAAYHPEQERIQKEKTESGQPKPKAKNHPKKRQNKTEIAQKLSSKHPHLS